MRDTTAMQRKEERLRGAVRPRVTTFRRYPAAIIAAAAERVLPALIQQACGGDTRRLDLGESGRCVLEAVAQPLGGMTWMVRCECGRRVRSLYERREGGPLLCRICMGAVYPSQRRSRSDRLLTQAFRIYDRIGTDYSRMPRRHQRPKGMHRRTYERLLRRAEELDERAIQLAWAEWSRR